METWNDRVLASGNVALVREEDGVVVAIVTPGELAHPDGEGPEWSHEDCPWAP